MWPVLPFLAEAVFAEEELAAAAGRRADQREAMGLTLQDRQAIVMGAQAAIEDVRGEIPDARLESMRLDLEDLERAVEPLELAGADAAVVVVGSQRRQRHGDYPARLRHGLAGN